VTASAADIFARLTVADREAIIRLYGTRRPFPDSIAGHEELLAFHELGLLTAVRPEGPRLWMLSALGYQVLGYAQQWRDRQAFALRFPAPSPALALSGVEGETTP
jgi:hypothetical protein